MVALASSYNAFDFAFAPDDASASFLLLANGEIRRIVGGAPSTLIGTWVVPSTVGASYEVFATLESGALNSGTTGSWQVLSSTRSWGVAFTGNFGSQLAQVRLDIREIGTTEVLDTTTVSFEATVES